MVVILLTIMDMVYMSRSSSRAGVMSLMVSIRQIGQDGPNGEKYMVPYSYLKNGRRDLFATGVTNQTDVSYAAGDFYISAQNVGIKGTMPDDELFRRTVTLRADKQYGKFRAGFSLRYTQSQYNVTNNNQIVYYGVTGSPGQIPISRFSDWRNDYFSSPDGYYTPYLDNNGKTPYFAKDNYREIGGEDEFFGNGELNFAATSWLRFTYRVGFTYSNADARSTRGAFQYSAFHQTLRDHGSLSITSAVSDASSVNERLTSEFFINANKRWGKIGTTLLLGQSYRENNFHFIQNGSNNLGNATFLSIQLRKGEPNVSIDNSKTRLERYFVKAGIDYNNWAFLEATGSYDFDSRLARPEGVAKKDDIAFFYPGASVSILLSEAIGAIKNSKTISYLKLRGAITKTGNAVIPVYAFENQFVGGTFFPYGDVLGFQSTQSSNANDLKPEFVLNREAGFDIGFLKNRINFEFSYYNQDNTQQVLGVQLSNTTGITQAVQNAGAFNNAGLEFDLRLTPLVKIKNVNINLSANYAHQWSEVTEIAGSVTELGIGNFNYAIKGFPAFVFKLTDYDRDDQGRVIVGADGMPTQKTGLSQFGQTQPSDLLGLNLNITWKNLTFSAVGEYRTGNQIVADQLGGFLDDNGISKRSGQNGRRAFIFPNSVIADPVNPGKFVPNTNVYTHLYGRLFWNSDLNTAVVSNYLADGSFWKLREVAINYDLPLAKLFGTKFTSTVKGASFTLSGRNLLMWLPESNQWTDPEFQGGNGNAGYTGNATGRSTAFNFPPTRIFGATLAVRF